MLTLKIMSNDLTLDDKATTKSFSLMTGVTDVHFVRPCYGTIEVHGHFNERNEDGRQEQFVRHAFGSVYVMNDRGKTIATFDPMMQDQEVWRVRGDLVVTEPAYPKDVTKEQVAALYSD